MRRIASTPLIVTLAIVMASGILWAASRPATRPAAPTKELDSFGCQCDDGTTCVVLRHVERTQWPPIGARAASTIDDADGPIGLVCFHAERMFVWKIPASQT